MMKKLLPICMLAMLLAGCPLEGDDGNKGSAGINCWDLNGNRSNDLDEDINKDGLWDANDCSAAASSAQNQTVELNHQHMCEAFASLTPPLHPVGCPSLSHTVPTGTLTDMTKDTFFDDGTGNRLQSCGDSPNNGLLSISLRDFVNSDGDTVKQGWYELEGGYIVSDGVITRNAGILDNQCTEDCKADSNCIASVAVYKTSESFSCRLFYHSDTAGKYERVCGLDAPGFTAEEQCKLTLGGNTRWAVRCP